MRLSCENIFFMLGNDGWHARRSLFKGFAQRIGDERHRHEEDDHQTDGQRKGKNNCFRNFSLSDMNSDSLRYQMTLIRS